MKVVFIITGLSTGGAQTMLLKLLERIDRTRFEPEVISLTTRGRIGPRIEALGLPVHALGMRPGRPNPIKFVCLVRLLRRSRPDAVNTWMYHADLLGGLAARIANIKALAWSIRNSDLSPDHSKRATLLTAKICACISGWLPRRILSCSGRARDIHIANGYDGGRMVLIPNGFDLSRFRPDAGMRDAVREELKLASGTLIAGLIARDDPQKNHAGFIEVAAQVHRTLPQVHFVLAGDGIDQNNKRLMALIDRMNLTGHVHLLGRRDDIPRLMASFDILASSSSFGEAFPNVLGEAMACGVPCLVTDAGDSAEIVGDTGRIVACGDMDGLAGKLIELLQWPAAQRAQLGALARQRICDRYEISDVTRRYEEFYVQLVNDH